MHPVRAVLAQNSPAGFPNVTRLRVRPCSQAGKCHSAGQSRKEPAMALALWALVLTMGITFVAFLLEDLAESPDKDALNSRARVGTT